MLVLFRIIFTGLFLWLMSHAARGAQANLSDDVGNAGSFALAVVVGLVAGLTWAPVLGEVLSGPMTGLMTDGSVSEDRTWFIRAARRCEARGWRLAAVLLAFWDAVLRPKMPAAYVVGMNNARPGGWFEKVFAREVWKFNNIANCVRAHDILKLRHDLDPGAHREPEVNIALVAHLREPTKTPPPMAVPAAGPAPLPARNARIQLFGGTLPPREPTDEEPPAAS